MDMALQHRDIDWKETYKNKPMGRIALSSTEKSAILSFYDKDDWYIMSVARLREVANCKKAFCYLHKVVFTDKEQDEDASYC